MKFYVVEITTYNDGTPDAKGVYEYEDLDDKAAETKAMASYHKKMGGAMDNEKYETELIIVSNSIGGILKVDYFNRNPQPEPTPEPTEA